MAGAQSGASKADAARVAAPRDVLVRCPWTQGHPLLEQYHDEEWGYPLRSEGYRSPDAAPGTNANEPRDEAVELKLFEFLLLESFQAGLSWLCVLKKRDAFRKAFAGFDPEKVARFAEDQLAALAQDPGIVRNKLKIKAAVGNAQAYLAVQKEFGSFEAYLWGFVGGQPLVNRWKAPQDVPVKTPLAEELSADLVLRGFKFVGPVIVYSLMQAIGMVNDHLTGCFRHGACAKA